MSTYKEGWPDFADSIFPMDDNAGIEEGVKIDTFMKGETNYSLSGQRLSTPKKGVNIIGGKKVIVK